MNIFASENIYLTVRLMTTDIKTTVVIKAEVSVLTSVNRKCGLMVQKTITELNSKIRTSGNSDA